MPNNYELVKEHTLRLLRHLPLNEEDDPELIILKGHLLVEEVLKELIKASLKKPEAIKINRLTFNQSLCWCHALLGEETLSWEWEAIRNVNNLRNDLAHNLKTSSRERKIIEFIQSVEHKEPNPKNNGAHNLSQRLTWVLSTLHTHLLNVVQTGALTRASTIAHYVG